MAGLAEKSRKRYPKLTLGTHIFLGALVAVGVATLPFPSIISGPILWYFIPSSLSLSLVNYSVPHLQDWLAEKLNQSLLRQVLFVLLTLTLLVVTALTVVAFILSLSNPFTAPAAALFLLSPIGQILFALTVNFFIFAAGTFLKMLFPAPLLLESAPAPAKKTTKELDSAATQVTEEQNDLLLSAAAQVITNFSELTNKDALKASISTKQIVTDMRGRKHEEHLLKQNVFQLIQIIQLFEQGKPLLEIQRALNQLASKHHVDAIINLKHGEQYLTGTVKSHYQHLFGKFQAAEQLEQKAAKLQEAARQCAYELFCLNRDLTDGLQPDVVAVKFLIAKSLSIARQYATPIETALSPQGGDTTYELQDFANTNLSSMLEKVAYKLAGMKIREYNDNTFYGEFYNDGDNFTLFHPLPELFPPAMILSLPKGIEPKDELRFRSAIEILAKLRTELFDHITTGRYSAPAQNFVDRFKKIQPTVNELVGKLPPESRYYYYVVELSDTIKENLQVMGWYTQKQTQPKSPQAPAIAAQASAHSQVHMMGWYTQKQIQPKSPQAPAIAAQASAHSQAHRVTRETTPILRVTDNTSPPAVESSSAVAYG